MAMQAGYTRTEALTSPVCEVGAVIMSLQREKRKKQAAIGRVLRGPKGKNVQTVHVLGME